MTYRNLSQGARTLLDREEKLPACQRASYFLPTRNNFTMLAMARKNPKNPNAGVVIPKVKTMAWPSSTIPDQCHTREMQIFDGFGGRYTGGRGKSQRHAAHIEWERVLVAGGAASIQW